MTIKFTQAGDVAFQVYNQAKCDGATDSQAIEVAWLIMQQVKQNELESKDAEEEAEE